MTIEKVRWTVSSEMYACVCVYMRDDGAVIREEFAPELLVELKR